MAPEILNEEKYNKSIDIWALGILLYEMLHGKSPFASEENPFSSKNPKNDKKEIQYNIKYKKLTFNEDLSDDCKDILRKMLENDSNKRIKIEQIKEHPFLLPQIKKRSSAIHLSLRHSLTTIKEPPLTETHKELLSATKKRLFFDDIAEMEDELNEFENKKTHLPSMSITFKMDTRSSLRTKTSSMSLKYNGPMKNLFKETPKNENKIPNFLNMKEPKKNKEEEQNGLTFEKFKSFFI